MNLQKIRCVECNKLIPLEEYAYGHDCEVENGEETNTQNYWLFQIQYFEEIKKQNKLCNKGAVSGNIKNINWFKQSYGLYFCVFQSSGIVSMKFVGNGTDKLFFDECANKFVDFLWDKKIECL